MDWDTDKYPEPSWKNGLYGKFQRPYRIDQPRFEISFKTLTVFILLLAGTVFTTSLVGGLWYSIALLAILGTHEFGHYWACRRNNVNASLPNFIPAPPFFIVGTFGAFIIIKEPIPNRRALIEIGASGPIAGFLVAIPVLCLGLALSPVQPAAPGETPGDLTFGASLIMIGLTKLMLGVDPMAPDINIALHPIGYAGWLGMFFTALNLLPMGQLDGGHVLYALFGNKHRVIAWLFFASLFVMGQFWTGWYVWAGLVFIMGLRHPPVLDETVALKRGHKWVGMASILIFILTFVPVPIDLIQ